MKKTIGLLLTGSVMLSTTAMAEGWNFLAGSKAGYTAEPAVSLLFGRMSPSTSGLDDGNIAGIELSLNCPLLQPPTNRIRQQASYTRYDEGTTQIDSFEINPHYVVEVSPGLEIGGGPGLGYITTSTANGSDPSFLAFNLGLSAHYTGFGPVFLGAEYRYQFTTEEDFGAAIKDDLNNGRFDIKVGYSF